MSTNRGYGKIFIVWSNENTGRKLACAVKKVLEENHQYEGIIGGESLQGAVYIGEQIFREIDQCVNAIIILTHSQDGILSFNVAMEWGYCHHRFNKSEEAYLINGVTLDEFDIQGLNANPIGETIDFENEEQLNRVAKRIVDIFVAKQEKKRKEADIECLELISDYSLIESEIYGYTISQYDLAKHILFYTQSAYMFHRINDARQTLNNFQMKYDISEQPLMKIAIDYAFASFEMFENIKKVKGQKSIHPGVFSRLNELFKDLETRAKGTLDDGSFKSWLLVSIYKNLNYIYYLKALDLGPDNNEEYAKKCEDYGNKCIEICGQLEEAKPTQVHYAKLCISYMYRNYYILYSAENSSLAEGYANNALKFKRDVFYFAKNNQRLSKGLIEYIETEYNVSLAESLKYCNNPIDINDRVESLDMYCRQITDDAHRRLSSLEYVKDVIFREKMQLYIVDFDLTIANTTIASAIAYRDAFTAAGALSQFSEGKVLSYLNEHLQNTFNQIVDSEISYSEFLSTYIESFSRNMDKVVLYDDVVDFFRTLQRKNKKVVIFSNRDYSSIQKIVEKYGVQDLFPNIVSSSDTSNKRKSAEDIEDYMNEYQTTNENTIFFGDSDEDKACALGADVCFVRVDRYALHHETKHLQIKDFSEYFK